MNNLSQSLLEIVSEASPRIGSLSEETMSAKSAPSKWSKKEILGHLIDSAYNNHKRFILAEAQGNLIFQGYDQVEWVKKNRYQERKACEILQTWKSSQQHLAHSIAGLPTRLLEEDTTEHNFHQICMRPAAEGTSSHLGYLIEDYLLHLEHHLSQILDV